MTPDRRFHDTPGMYFLDVSFCRMCLHSETDEGIAVHPVVFPDPYQVDLHVRESLGSVMLFNTQLTSWSLLHVGSLAAVMYA